MVVCMIEVKQEIRLGVGLGELVEEAQDAGLISPGCLNRHEEQLASRELGKVTGQRGFTRSAKTLKDHELGCRKGTDEDADGLGVKVETLLLGQIVAELTAKLGQGDIHRFSRLTNGEVVMHIHRRKCGEYALAVAKLLGGVHGRECAAAKAACSTGRRGDGGCRGSTRGRRVTALACHTAACRGRSAVAAGTVAGIVGILVKAGGNVDVLVVLLLFHDVQIVLAEEAEGLVDEDQVDDEHRHGEDHDGQRQEDQRADHQGVAQELHGDADVLNRLGIDQKDRNANRERAAAQEHADIGEHGLEGVGLDVVFDGVATDVDHSRGEHRNVAGQKQKAHVAGDGRLDCGNLQHGSDLVDHVARADDRVRALNARTRNQDADGIEERDRQGDKILSGKIIVLFHGVFSSPSSSVLMINVSSAFTSPSAFTTRMAAVSDCSR